jgi:glycyl-tRNA synthetase beta chain
MSRDLVFEIGCEEIPAKMLTRALAELPGLARTRLDEARLTASGATVIAALGTPRRVTLLVRGLPDRQPDLSERVVGPPIGAAFGADGAPTKAALGFAQKNGVDAASLEKAEVPGKKGLYVVATRHVAGRATFEVLPELLSSLVMAIPWPKSMRWGWGDFNQAFVRPLHWIVALWGDEVVPVKWGAVTAGRISRGHRFLSNGAVEIASAETYADLLRAAHVIVDPEERKRLVTAELARIERDVGATAIPDPGLVDEVANLCEYPVGVSATFDRAFLEVPEEVLVTAMRNHQRYFAMRDASGKLAPTFVTMSATVVRDAAVVRAGNERVIASRLSDAKFFFGEDQKKELDELRKKLDDVVFQAKLGAARSTGDKVRRIEGIVAALADRVTFDARVAARAAALCKSDLLTGVVGEFPELQGIMGSHYVRIALGRDPAWADAAAAVGQAVAEHYMPRGAGAALPDSVEGAIVGIADRLDTLVGCFGTGLEPTGSADPYGLRRAANAILAINLDLGKGGKRERVGHGKGWPLSLDTLIEIAAQQFAGMVEITDTDCGELHEFFRGRLRTLLIDEGLAALDVDAALGAGFDDVCDARLRARALAVVPAGAREVFKRIANILDDAGGKGIAISGDVKPGLFAEAGNVEHRLWNAFGGVTERLNAAVANQDYRDMFAILVELQPVVAAFFDKGGVMVMDPKEDVRENRLSLLQRILTPFAAIADFRVAAGAAAGAAA